MKFASTTTITITPTTATLYFWIVKHSTHGFEANKLVLSHFLSQIFSKAFLGANTLLYLLLLNDSIERVAT